MATFTWCPAPGARRSIKPRVLSAKFGDGYELRVGDGINTQMAVWSVSFNGLKRSSAAELEAFLITQNGVTSFDWSDPDGVSAKYICREWDRSELGAGLLTISATFEQVPD